MKLSRWLYRAYAVVSHQTLVSARTEEEALEVGRKALELGMIPGEVVTLTTCSVQKMEEDEQKKTRTKEEPGYRDYGSGV